jgi:hypothetical protein
MLVKVDQKKTDTSIHISETYIPTVFSPTENERDKHACMHVHVCIHVPTAHRSSTASQGCASVHYMCECVCCYYFANPSTVSVCLAVQCHGTSVCPDACVCNDEVLSMCNKHLMLGQPVIYTHTYTHSHTFNTFTQAQYSVNSHEKHANSLKR